MFGTVWDGLDRSQAQDAAQGPWVLLAQNGPLFPASGL